MNWHNGKTGMMGTSHNGTIPVAAATTGVQGLEAIVPIAAISDWCDYYRSFGLVRAPLSAANGQNGNNGFLGEDLDVLAEYTYSRADEAPVSVEAVVAVLRANVAGAQDVVRRLGEHVAKAAPCACARAAAHAVITAPEAITAEARGRLRLLHGRDYS